ncbi:MAG: hypothetical protein ABJE10_17690 [bacterium]
MNNLALKVALCALAAFDVGCISSCGGGGGETTQPNVTHPGNGGTDTTTTNPPPPPPGPIPATGWYLRNVIFDGKAYPFQVFIPAGYTPAKKWPAIVFLHGGNDVGSDGYKQLSVGLGPYINGHRPDFPAIGVFPQMSAEGNGVGRANYISTVIMSLDSTIKEFPGIDPTRIYLNGLSFGGIQGFEIVYRNPTRFAAWVPISAAICETCIAGAPNQQQMAYSLYASTLPTMPFWQFQGDQDQAIPTPAVRAFEAVYQAKDPNAKYTEYAGYDHSTTYPKAYGTQALWDWLWAQHR